MNVLLVSPNQSKRYNCGWQLFRDEIGRQHKTFYYGNGYPNHDTYYIPDVVKQHGPFDIVILGDCKNTQYYNGIDEVTIPKIYIAGDYFNYYPKRENYYLERNNAFINHNKMDIAFFDTTTSLELFLNCKKSQLLRQNVKGYLLPFSVDINVFYDRKLNRDVDVMAVYNDFAKWCYPERHKIKDAIYDLGELLGITCLTGNKRNGIVGELYREFMCRSKIFVTNNNIFKSMSMKYTEAMASNTFLLADEPEDMELLGFKSGEHLVTYKDLDDLAEKIAYYLANESERLRIAKTGMEYTRENHSTENRVKQMFGVINEAIG